MTNTSDRWHDFELLLGRVLDGIQSDEDVRRLNQVLRATRKAAGVHELSQFARLADMGQGTGA